MHDALLGLELPLCPVLAEMERAGMLVDRGALADFGYPAGRAYSGADEALIYELAGEEFNINSTQQLGRILFDKLGLPPVKKRPRRATPPTPTCWRSCGASTPIMEASSGLPAVGQAEIHLCGRADQGDRGGWADPHLLPEHGDRHRAAARRSPTSRISPSAPSWGRSCGRCSWRDRARCWWTRTTPRSSCACWLTWRRTST